MTPTNVELVILRNLLTNEEFMRRVLPFVKPDYFQGIYKTLFKEAGKFVAKYNKLPSEEAFSIELNSSNMTDEQFQMSNDILPQLFTKESSEMDWLLDTTEKWCQDRAIYLSLIHI